MRSGEPPIDPIAPCDGAVRAPSAGSQTRRRNLTVPAAMKRLLGIHPRTILLVSYGGIGDILLTTPLIRSLKRAFPDARVDLYVQGGREGILQGNEDVGAVITTRRRHGVRSYLDFVRDCAGRYDLAVSVRMSDRQTLFARVAGWHAVGLVPKRGPGARWMPAVLSGWACVEDQHTAARILSLTEVLGIERETRCTMPRDPSSVPRLDAVLPFAWREEAFATLHLYPRNRYKRWTLEGWQVVAEALVEGGLRVVVTGSSEAGELSYVKALLERLPGDAIINVAGTTSLADVAELLRVSRVYVGLDTAVTHLAAATGTPTVALYGPPLGCTYFPYHPGFFAQGIEAVEPGHESSGVVHVLRGTCGCTALPSRCERRPLEASDCMRSIAPRRVAELAGRIAARPD